MRIALAIAALILTSLPSIASNTVPRRMSDDDFFLDRKKLLGKHVEVASHFEIKGDLMFMALEGDTNATFIAFDGLPREDRKSIYARCQTRCAGTVQGLVAVIDSPFGRDIGIKAEKLTLEP